MYINTSVMLATNMINYALMILILVKKQDDYIQTPDQANPKTNPIFITG